MPQFNEQNKKKIDPRYFSEELLEEQLDHGERWGRCPPGFVPHDARYARGDPGVCINNKGISRDRPKVVDTKAAVAAGAADWEKTIAGARKQVAGVEAAKAKRVAAAKTAGPAAAKAAVAAAMKSKKAPARRRRGKLYAKGPTAGKIQGLLLKAFGVMAESKILSEANIRSVLGSRKIDGKIGPTTLKNMLKIPNVKAWVDDPAALAQPAQLQGVLNILQKCAAGGFKDSGCRPRGESPTAVMSAPKAAAYNNCMQQCKVKLPGYQCAAKCKGAKAAPGAEAAEKKRPPMAPKAAYSDCMQRCKIKLPGYMCAPKCKAAHPGA